MHVIADHATDQPAPARRATARDQRYVAPTLLVDLIETAYRTPFWSPTQLIVRNLAQDLTPGAQFSGVFQFDGAVGCGVFEAVVTRSISARQLIGAAFTWVNLHGSALMDAFEAQRRRDPLGRGPQMTVMLSRPTLAWSFSGLVVAGAPLPAAPGGRVHGLLRHDKAQEPKPFSAGVIRQVTESATGRPAMALKFAALPTATLAVLDSAARQRAAVATLGSAA
ncbi:MAG: hypothetical protein HY060_21985 [Proteobacteria bacterium]|nr:hypothetical protein [Pseudomonadota bacterium]